MTNYYVSHVQQHIGGTDATGLLSGLLEFPAPELDDQMEQFYRSTRSSLLAYFRYSNRDDALAEDLTQDSYMKYFEHWHTKNGQIDQPDAYLWKIARTKQADQWRRRPKSPYKDGAGALIPVQVHMLTPELAESGPWDSTDSPEDGLLRSFEQERRIGLVRDAMCTLGETKRAQHEAVYLRYLNDPELQPQEIAKLIGKLPNTVSTNIRAGLASLGEILIAMAGEPILDTPKERRLFERAKTENDTES